MHIRGDERRTNWVKLKFIARPQAVCRWQKELQQIRFTWRTRLSRRKRRAKEGRERRPQFVSPAQRDDQSYANVCPRPRKDWPRVRLFAEKRIRNAGLQTQEANKHKEAAWVGDLTKWLWNSSGSWKVVEEDEMTGRLIRSCARDEWDDCISC